MSGLALDVLGYVASALVVTSLAMSSVLKFRVISLVGSATFFAYGVLIGSVPVALTNVIIMAINVVFLYRLFSHQEAFDVVEVEANSKFLRRYLDHNAIDIGRAWPGFEYHPAEEQLRLFVFRDMVPAGLFIAGVEGATARVEIDFAGRDYRDLKNARVLFGRGQDVLTSRGIDRIVSPADSDLHRTFLVRFGFRPVDGEYVLDLVVAG